MSFVIKRSLRGKESQTTGKGMERAREILATARDLFVEKGYSGLSMRAVAARLGVTLSNVQHYYRTREALVEAMLLRTFEDYQATLDEIEASMPAASRAEKFTRAMTFFITDIQKPRTRGMFLELSALATRNAFASDISDRMYARARKAIKRLIRDVIADVPDRELTIRAALIFSQLMGLAFFGKGRLDTEELPGIADATRTAMLAIASGRPSH